VLTFFCNTAARDIDVAGLRQEQDLYIRLIDSATKQVRVVSSCSLHSRAVSLAGERRVSIASRSLLSQIRHHSTMIEDRTSSLPTGTGLHGL